LRGIFGVTSPVLLWWDIQPISAGLFGVPVGFAVIVLVSLVTPAPAAIQELVDYVRYPRLNATAGNRGARRAGQGGNASRRAFVGVAIIAGFALPHPCFDAGGGLHQSRQRVIHKEYHASL
jgi:hypothetical protein